MITDEFLCLFSAGPHCPSQYLGCFAFPLSVYQVQDAHRLCKHLFLPFGNLPTYCRTVPLRAFVHIRPGGVKSALNTFLNKSTAAMVVSSQDDMMIWPVDL